MISTKKVVYKICQAIDSIKSDATTTSGAVTALQSTVTTLQAGLLLGEIKPYAGSTAPSKWLICDGSAVSRTTYSDLFAVIGTTYGTGDGSTTFNLPDMKGRTPIGVSSGHALGTTGGEETHTLTMNEMPRHDHNPSGSVRWYDDYNTHTNAGNATATGRWWYIALTSLIALQGNNQPHNNMQPYTTVNFIIYAGV